jgi:CheY-like chemotaxis protein
MTKKLLGFAKQQPSTTNATELNKVVETNLDVFKKSVVGAVQITLELAEDLWPVQVSVAELKDALINLIVNARQAMPSGGTLLIRTENRSMSAGQMRDTRLAAGNYVTLAIVDTGIGMDQQTIDRVFEPFFTTKGELGTGLGLSQVYGFVQRADGDIQISSSLGKGSQFTLYFPPSADSDSAASLPDTAPSAAIDTLPGTGQILLVDDEPALVDMSNEILTSRGYRVTIASGGDEALQAMSGLTDRRFDLLISDIIMPNMDGQRLAQLARQQQPGLKVLFVSGYNQAAAIKLKPGYTDLLTKPFSSNELLNKTRQMIISTPPERQEANAP